MCPRLPEDIGEITGGADGVEGGVSRRITHHHDNAYGRHHQQTYANDFLATLLDEGLDRRRDNGRDRMATRTHGMSVIHGGCYG